MPSDKIEENGMEEGSNLQLKNEGEGKKNSTILSVRRCSLSLFVRLFVCFLLLLLLLRQQKVQ